MTDKLYKMLLSKFPNLPSGQERVTTYCGVERVHLNLKCKEFLELEGAIFGPETLKEIAKRVFDVPFRFYTHQEEGEVIFFSPTSLDDYSQKYAGHSIEVLQDPHKFPLITFSTGNRGDAILCERQRNKYFHFGLCINETMLEMTTKK